MEHRRHFTVAEAEALRPWVEERVRRLRRARDELLCADERLVPVPVATGGSWPGRRHAVAAVTLLMTLEELDRREVVVRDADRGLVDFPALRDGEEVYLCWLVGEPQIGHWHGLEAGFLGREPL